VCMLARARRLIDKPEKPMFFENRFNRCCSRQKIRGRTVEENSVILKQNGSNSTYLCKITKH
jgi:hypothetical protein